MQLSQIEQCREARETETMGLNTQRGRITGGDETEETRDNQNVDRRNVLRTDGAMMGREESSEVGMTFGK